MDVWVVMRAHNDMPVITRTLDMLARQTLPHRLLVMDNESSDGTLEAVRERAGLIITVPAGTYVPGRVINQAMAATDGDIVVFLNSDCTPRDENSLARLTAALEAEPEAAAVFGRQDPRPDCHLLQIKDTEETYGDGSRQRYWRHCFSMASSAIRRRAWEQMPFSEAIQYSEDIDWTWRARQAGWKIIYAADSGVFHSHNYTWSQFRRRHYGEGRAEAVIFDWQPWERTLLRYSLLPYVRQVASDSVYCLKRGRLDWLAYSPLYRLAQLLGRRAGFLDGLRDAAGREKGGPA